MYDIPFDRSFLQLSNGIRHVMPSTDRKLQLTAKASMVQPVSQPAVCFNGLKKTGLYPEKFRPVAVPFWHVSIYYVSFKEFVHFLWLCGAEFQGK